MREINPEQSLRKRIVPTAIQFIYDVNLARIVFFKFNKGRKDVKEPQGTFRFIAQFKFHLFSIGILMVGDHFLDRNPVVILPDDITQSPYIEFNDFTIIELGLEVGFREHVGGESCKRGILQFQATDSRVKLFQNLGEMLNIRRC